MNEKINELMLEATEDMPKTYYWPGQYVEKFAELIVRECVLETMDAIHHEYSIRKQVYDHFGIKQ